MVINNGTTSPLFVTPVNGKFVIAVYQGSFSKHDIWIKYRQKVRGKWSRIRTPKHIHWTVDILIKMHEDPEQTKQFLDFLISVWEKTSPIHTTEERKEILKLKNLLIMNEKEMKFYKSLGEKGEYSIKFLILLARLLMIQEKTNLEKAFMFKDLLEALKKGDDIFRVVSIATHR